MGSALVGANLEITTAVYHKLEDINEKKAQSPFRIRSSGRVMNGDAPDAQEEGRPVTKAPLIKSDTAILDIPQTQDTLKILCSKLTAIADVITAGQSVAIATGYMAAAHQEHCAVEKAVREMSPLEHESWTWFQTDSCALPEMDWKGNIDSTPLSSKPLKSARRRAEALNRLYKTDQAQPYHSVWFTKNHLVYLPLVKAMARVIGVERELIGGGILTATQLADLQSINKILSVAGQIVNIRASEPLLLGINCAQRVLASQRDTLRNLIPGRKRKREA